MALVAVAKNTVKLGVCVGAIYVTVEQGVWSSSSLQGTEAYDSVTHHVVPFAHEYFTKIPSVKDTRMYIADKWNSGVKTAFSFLASSPGLSKDKASQCVNYVKDYARANTK